MSATTFVWKKPIMPQFSAPTTTRNRKSGSNRLRYCISPPCDERYKYTRGGGELLVCRQFPVVSARRVPSGHARDVREAAVPLLPGGARFARGGRGRVGGARRHHAAGLARRAHGVLEGDGHGPDHRQRGPGRDGRLEGPRLTRVVSRPVGRS